MERETERQRLLNERERLHQQIARLIADSVHVKAGGGPLGLRTHMDDIQKHLLEFQTFRADLDRFHRLFGPLGE